jgi:hypothetical protein
MEALQPIEKEDQGTVGALFSESLSVMPGRGQLGNHDIMSLHL